MRREILMPPVTPSMTDGKIARWHVAEGQSVAAGDLLVEVATPTAMLEIEAEGEGRVERILVPAGTEGVKVNTPIAILLGAYFLNRLHVIVFPVPKVDEHLFISGNFFVRVLFGFGRRRRAEEQVTAVEREAEIRALAYDELFAEARRSCRDDLGCLRIFAVPVVDTKLRWLGVGVFFIAGLLLLSRVDVRRAITEAGNDPKGVVI